MIRVMMIAIIYLPVKNNKRYHPVLLLPRSARAVASDCNF